jgi:hypothetical protein
MIIKIFAGKRRGRKQGEKERQFSGKKEREKRILNL